MSGAVDGTSVAGLHLLMIAICRGQSLRRRLVERLDGTFGQESFGRSYRKIPAAAAPSWNPGARALVTVTVVVTEEEDRRMSVVAAVVAVVVVEGTGLGVTGLAGQKRSVVRRGSRHRLADSGVQRRNLRRHLVEVEGEVDAACRTWRRTLSVYDLRAVSCAAVVPWTQSLFALCRQVLLRRCWRRQCLVDSLKSGRCHTESAEAAACDPAGNRTWLLVADGDRVWLW